MYDSEKITVRYSNKYAVQTQTLDEPGGIQMEFLDFSSAAQCKEYEDFLEEQNLGNFTQSIQWCDVKNEWKYEVVLIRDSQQKIVASMLVLIKQVPVIKCSFLYCPRGPVCSFQDKAILSELMDAITVLAHRYHAFLFKCDPLILASDTEKIQTLQDLGLILQPDLDERAIQCRCNYMLDIKDKTADSVFQSFHSKWRYNIRLAERKGVECKYFDKHTLTNQLDDFYPLMQETGSRDGFNIRSKEYFRSIINNLDTHCRLYLCYYQGRAVSGAIAIQYGGRTCYVYGASSGADRGVMPNYLMQWNMIQWAIENGNVIYDFQGIPHYSDETHPNYGVYRFKQGFKGQVVEYAGEFDYIFSPRLKKLIDSLYQAKKIIQYRKTRLADKVMKSS